jgi:hypothetical protein
MELSRGLRIGEVRNSGPSPGAAGDLQAESALGIGLGPSDNLATTATTIEIGEVNAHAPRRPTVGFRDRPHDRDRRHLRGLLDGAERTDPDRHQERDPQHRDVSPDVIRGEIRELLRGG